MKKDTAAIIRSALVYPEDALRKKIERLGSFDYLAWVRGIEFFIKNAEATVQTYLAEKNNWTAGWVPPALNGGVPVLLTSFRDGVSGNLQQILKTVEARATNLLNTVVYPTTVEFWGKGGRYGRPPSLLVECGFKESREDLALLATIDPKSVIWVLCARTVFNSHGQKMHYLASAFNIRWNQVSGQFVDPNWGDDRVLESAVLAWRALDSIEEALSLFGSGLFGSYNQK